MERKGIVSVIEMVITAIVLLTAFAVIFPRNVYHTNWGMAQTLLNSRDVMVMLDRLPGNRLYYYSYNQDAMTSFIRSVLGNSTMVWPESNSLVKSKLSIACNCTDEQRSNLISWLNGMTVNNRSLDVSVYYTDLEIINPSLLPDVLVIWQNKSISSAVVSKSLKDFILQGNGIVEVADFPPSFNFTNDTVQRSIFGIQNCTVAEGGCGNPPDANDNIISPPSATAISYAPYKYFYRMPLTVKGFTNVSAPAGCPSTMVINGTFRFNQTNYAYWICSVSSTIYFDTDGNNIADMNVPEKSNFTLNGTKFYMSFVNVGNFGISLRQGFGQQEYRFRDFIGPTRVYPIDNPQAKTFMSSGNYSVTAMRPVVVLNGSGSQRTAWTADFSRNGFASVGDDQKMLFLSLLFWASNKHTASTASGSIPLGYSTSYLNTVSQDKYDMFEVYSFSLGTGQPY